MSISHQNDPDLIARLLADPGTWVVVGLSTNEARPAYRVSRWLRYEEHKRIIPVHPSAAEVFDEPGFASLADVPDQDVRVVDCFVNSERVGAVVDEAIAHRERLGIDAVWLQLGVVDEDAAARAREAGLGVVMDTCPMIEARRLGTLGAVR